MIQIEDDIPIIVAHKLITGTTTCNILGREMERPVFDDDDLRQIAYHLLIHIGEEFPNVKDNEHN